MDFTRPVESEKLLTLQQAAQSLAVSVDVLLDWNKYNILKPTITRTGEIGYTHEQINCFLEIRGQLQKETAPETTETILQNQNIPQKYNIPTFSKHNRNKLSPIVPISVFSVMAVSLIIVLLTQQSKLSPLLDRYLLMSQQAASSMGKVLSEQTTRGFNLSGSNMFTLPIQIKNQIASDMNLNNEGETVLEDKINALNETASHRAGQTSLLTKGNNVTKTPTGTGGNVLADSTMAYSETTTTSNKNTTNNNSVFDNNGNIKGTKGETTSANLLATALGATALAQDENPLRPNADQNILLGFFGISLVLLFFVLKKQMAYSAQKTKALGIDPHNFINDTEEQKVLQVDQKTDGTVVLCLQGKEYKVSKPELDSESDQFIERLMGLVQEDVKEIDYDALSDSTIRLSAPLSKLVTRLGFVGIKRDLFFPRTSKNRVLFRRYLTEQDLISMNLTADQISREFLSNL